MMRNSCFLPIFMLFTTLLSAQTTLPPEMVFVEGGTFTMGCTPEQQPCNSWESPSRIVRLPSFWIGKFELPASNWESIMGQNNPPSWAANMPNDPMENVSITDCLTFCNRLSLSSNPPLTPCYYADKEFTTVFDAMLPSDSFGLVEAYWNPNANGYRLPTESEWEFCARGGTMATVQTLYSGSNILSEVAWFENDGSPSGTKSVGQKMSNALGLFDMSGNIWEWCIDTYFSYSYYPYPSCAPGNFYIIRSGDWADGGLSQYRVAYRSGWYPRLRHGLIGLRLARNAD